MAEVTDILCGEDGELMCQAGDFIVGAATIQHQADLLCAVEGEYKQFPTTGVGLSGFLNDDDHRALIRKIRLQFTADKMLVSKVQFNDVLKVNASY